MPDCVSPTASKSLLTYLAIDPGILGWIAWVSLFVTVGGFAFSWWQLIKVANATQAAKTAAENTAIVVRGHEQSNKLSSSIGYLKSALVFVGDDDIAASTAYLTIGWEVLIDAKELTKDVQDKDFIIESLTTLRRIIEDIGMPGAMAAGTDVLQQRHKAVNGVIDGLGNMAARARFVLAGIA